MDDDTLFKITYWEIPGQQRHAQDHFFRFCLGATAAIFMFDGKRLTFGEGGFILFIA